MDNITHPLKKNKGDLKYFKPKIEYSRFITNNVQRSEDEVIWIQYSKLKQNENYESIIEELQVQNISFGNKTQ